MGEGFVNFRFGFGPWRSCRSPPVAGVRVLLRLCRCFSSHSERSLWLGGFWRAIRGMWCFFGALRLAGLQKVNCGVSESVDLWSSGKFMNEAVLWCGVVRRDAAAFVLKRPLFLKEICEKLSVSIVIAVIVGSAQSPWLALTLKAGTELKTYTGRRRVDYGTDYVQTKKNGKAWIRSVRDGWERCEEWGLTSAERTGMRDLLNGFRKKNGLDIGERWAENPRK